MTAANGWDEERAERRIAALAGFPGAALPILHALMEEFGYVDERAIPMVAEALNLSRAEIVGVLHFYHDFRTERAGDHVLRVCRAESCQAMGAEALVGHLCQRLGIAIGETTHDGRLTVEPVYCLGNCALSPAVMLDGALHGRVSAAMLDRLLEART